MKNKPLMILILVLAPIALGFGLYKAFFAGSSGVDLPDSLQFANLETGKLVSFKRGSFPTVPIMDKTTRKYTIYPVEKNEKGSWVIVERYRDGLADLAKTTTLKIDLDTFIVKTN